MTDRGGQQFGNYRLIKQLGQGGFADVYLGEHVHLENQAAIKVLHSSLTEKKAQDFETEAKRLVRLSHPNIVRVLDYAIHEGIPFLVMEYAPNGSLRDLHPKGSRLPLDQIVRYVNQVASALQYIHDNKLIHRDVKPANMLLGSDNKVLLSDIGIAVIAHSENSLILQGCAGTSEYMAPEQWNGRPVPASDQYSLGIVVFEWLSGVLPFDGSRSEILYKHESESPRALHTIIPTISLQVERVIFRTLAKDPKERFESVVEFATALEEAFLGQSVSVSSLFLAAPEAQEERTLQTPPNEQRRNSFEQLWVEVKQAQGREDSKRVFLLLLEMLRMKNLIPSQRDLVKSEIRRLPQMIPWCIQQARKASTQGNWQKEIRLWEDILSLDVSQQEITKRLTISPLSSMEVAIRERLRIARQNKEYAWIYTEALRSMSEQDNATAGKHLESLWRQAPFYGDPHDLAHHIVGLSAANNYEQALTKKLTDEQQKKREEEIKRERRRIKLEQDTKRKIRAAGVSSGTSAGCLAGILLTPLLWGLTRGGIPGQTVIGHLLISSEESKL